MEVYYICRLKIKNIFLKLSTVIEFFVNFLYYMGVNSSLGVACNFVVPIGGVRRSQAKPNECKQYGLLKPQSQRPHHAVGHDGGCSVD